MSTFELSIVNQGPEFYEFSSNYDGVRYYTRFDYNRRNDTWYLTLRDSGRETLLSGLPCLTNTPLLITKYALDGVFDFGEILIADTNDDDVDPSYENFGDAVSAFYTSILS